MGFDEADPRQLAPSVGTLQVGITISAGPSPAPSKSTTPPALVDSMTRADSDLFGSLGFMTHLPTFRPAFADLRTGINLTFGGYQIYINHWGSLRLTDSVRMPVATTSMAAIKDGVPTHATTLRVSHDSHPNTRHRAARDYSGGTPTWRKRSTEVTEPTVRAPFQVFMANTHEPTADDKGQ